MALKLKATRLRASKATQRIGKLSQSLLVRNTLWMLGADGGTTIILAVYFVVLARVLQPSEFGAFAGALALVSIVAPFAGWGASKVLVMAVARDPRVFAMYWGNALVSIVITATCLLIILKLVGRYVLPVSAASLIPSLALAELLFSAVTESCALRISGVREVEGYCRGTARRIDRPDASDAVIRSHCGRTPRLNVGTMVFSVISRNDHYCIRRNR